MTPSNYFRKVSS